MCSVVGVVGVWEEGCVLCSVVEVVCHVGRFACSLFSVPRQTTPTASCLVGKETCYPPPFRFTRVGVVLLETDLLLSIGDITNTSTEEH